jgi:hypothetical protein
MRPAAHPTREERRMMPYKYFLGALFLLFLYIMYAPTTIICTATAASKNVNMLGRFLSTTISN